MRITGSASPSGAAGGDLSGTYPNPTVANGAITAAKVASANVDGTAGTASMRTLGTTSTTAAAGDDGRFPTAAQKLALAGTSGTPGTGNEYVTDDDPRNSDARTPTTHGSSHRYGGSDPIEAAVVVAPASPYTVASGVRRIIVAASTTIVLPDSNIGAGEIITVVATAAATVTFQRAGSDTIDGGAGDVAVSLAAHGQVSAARQAAATWQTIQPPASTTATVYTYTSPGASTPTITGTVAILETMGGGGGGGSGRVGAAGSTRSGGAGGAGGSYTRCVMRCAELTAIAATLTVTVGGGGAGGAAQTADATNGNPGVAGSPTTIAVDATVVCASYGGGGGAGGDTTVDATGGVADTGGYEPGGDGGTGRAAFNTDQNAADTPRQGAAGGGGGGGLSTGDARGNGGTGGRGFAARNNASGTAPAGGGSDGAAGTAASTPTTLRGGDGGGGGAASLLTNGGAGGAGVYGGGGGGGGAAVNATGDSGAGGAGGAGWARVTFLP